jgi:hypothetical protein
MRRILLSLATAVTLSLLTPNVSSAEDAFNFYGLEFGMTREAAGQVFPLLKGNIVREPGHGMSTLELYFDRRELLMEIRASYPKPEGKLENTGLQRALREKFLFEVREGLPGITANVDEYGNRAAVTVVFQSHGIREENIEYYKQGFLKAME